MSRTLGVIALLVAFAGAAHAQNTQPASRMWSSLPARLVPSNAGALVPDVGIGVGRPTNANVEATSAPARQSGERRERSVGRAILGGVVGGTGGFFAGGYLGAWIEGDRCNCDDPGLKGALIGMPIGAAVGAVLGAKWLF